MSIKSTVFPLAHPALIYPVQALPSGGTAELFEVLIDDVGGEDWLRFRFLAPEIGADDAAFDFEASQADFEFLCGEIAMPYLAQFEVQADVVVISLLDRPVPFGTTDPDAVQLIEAFRVSAGTCAWEGIW